MTVTQADEGDPLFLVILESHHIRLEFIGADKHFAVGRGEGRPVGFILFLVIFLGVLSGDEHTRAASVTVDRASFASCLPCFEIQTVDKFHADIRGEIYGDRNGMVHPFLYGSLHLHFLEPVDIVGSGFVVGRPFHQFVYLGLGVVMAHGNTVYFHPFDEFGMIHHKLLECIAVLVHEIHTDIDIVCIDLAAAFVDRHEHRLDAR